MHLSYLCIAMKSIFKQVALALIFCCAGITLNAQQTEFPKLDDKKVQEVIPMLEAEHGGKDGLQKWRDENPWRYYGTLWYLTESFYVKRDYFVGGVTLDGVVDVRRLDHARKENDTAVVQFRSFRDVVVLLPANKLIYKP